MECGKASLMLSVALLCFIHIEATHQILSQERVSPDLKPESSKKFFGKDYPNDNRPGVDVLHFKHPYPVVQDSGDFDTDYVKDENSDNGQFKAQQEYDRLRHKLKKEKAEAEEALAKRRMEEKELKEAVEKYNQQKDERARAEEEARRRAKADAMKKAEDKQEAKETSEGWSWSWDWWPFSWPKWGSSERKPSKVEVKEKDGVDAAAEDTTKAMDNLEECKKELAKARAELKEIMDELEEAKAKEKDTDAAAAAAAKRQLEAETVAEQWSRKTGSEKEEYEAAKDAYMKQKDRVDELQADLDAASAKVKAHRDAEDPDGGVYNTKSENSKSLAISISPKVPFALLAALALL